MLNFEPIALRQRPLIHSNLFQADGYGCEFSFANLFLWGKVRMAAADGVPVFLSESENGIGYLLPHGENREQAVQLLREDAKARGIRFRLLGLSARDCALLQARYPDEFDCRALRDSFDYVYDIERLTELRGKKLQAKRNHCNRFEQEHPDYRVAALTKETLPLCRAFAAHWYEEHLLLHKGGDLSAEQRALNMAFDCFDALGMEGICLQTADGIVAFSMGNRIRKDTFDVNFEKALSAVNGAYPMVNREFARTLHRRYPELRFLNREDDMGIEGLRRAKESYVPDLLLEKMIAEER